MVPGVLPRAVTGCPFGARNWFLDTARGPFATPEALKRVARGREAHPGKRRKGSPTPEGLQEGAEIFAPPSGCVPSNPQEPRVGAFAPTRGYRLQRLRRN